MTSKSNTFPGFPKKTIEFFISLRFNNDKAWFNEHKGEYEEYVLKPFQELVIALSPAILSIDPQLDVTPKVDKTIARIYRDVRFSKDKSPYRSNLWISFKRSAPDWKDSPTYYFELTPEGYHYGMGFFQAERETMDKFRLAIDHGPAGFLKATEFYRKGREFLLGGDSYKKPLAQKPPEIAEWYNKKNFWLSKQKPLDDIIFSPKIVEELSRSFLSLKPLYDYLWSIKSGV